jgi:hypothetical protein
VAAPALSERIRVTARASVGATDLETAMTRAAAFVALLLLAPAARAYDANPAERAQDRHELRQDRRARADDRRDLAVMEDLLARYDAARARRDRGGLAAVERAVDAELVREVRESRHELRKDRREIRRDVREVRADDPRDARDDRRDLRDDVRDARVERDMAARREAIQSELRGLRGRMAPPALDRKRALIADLVGLAQAELAQDHQEMREDRRELREDRRESNERWR